MNEDSELTWLDIPDLRDPILLVAFAGWNDASRVATGALEILQSRWSAHSIALVDPENFFDFAKTRPSVSLSATGQRQLHWQQNEFFAHQLHDSDRDVVLLIGTEPDLRWRSFCRIVLKVAAQLRATTMVTLGALLADVPHTFDPRLTGFSTEADIITTLNDMDVNLSSYEGPTGIIGVLHDAWHSSGRSAVSLWGAVPHYISAVPNPPVTLALLRCLETLLKLDLPLEDVEHEARLFREQIDERIEQNPEAQEYVRRLEQAAFTDQIDSPPHLIEQLEEFLRRGRPSDDRPDA
jgi:proteasome assembly chaperone (PAC2) family protein